MVQIAIQQKRVRKYDGLAPIHAERPSYPEPEELSLSLRGGHCR